MVATARPLTSTMADVVELRCPGLRSEPKWLGTPCARLLGTAQLVAVPYSLTLSCPRCHTRSTFEVGYG